MIRERSQHHRRHHLGASLIEVLVAILVVSVGILSMVAMQANAVKFSKTSENRAIGALLVNDLADRMRANRAGFYGDQYAFATASYPGSGVVTEPTALDTCNTSATSCSADQLAAKDLSDWRRSVFFALPGGFARISARDTTNNAVDVWLAWLDPTDTAEGGVSQDPTAVNECPANFVGSAATGATQAKPRCMYFRINL